MEYPSPESESVAMDRKRVRVHEPESFANCSAHQPCNLNVSALRPFGRNKLGGGKQLGGKETHTLLRKSCGGPKVEGFPLRHDHTDITHEAQRNFAQSLRNPEFFCGEPNFDRTSLCKLGKVVLCDLEEVAFGSPRYSPQP